MLVIEKPKRTTISDYNHKQLRWLVKRYKIQRVGKAYLKSVAGSAIEPFYKGWWYLVFRLKMCDKMESAAKLASQKLGFTNVARAGVCQLDPKHWKSIGGSNFVCTSPDYAVAVQALFSGSSHNSLECRRLAELMALRAFQDAVGNPRFDRYLKAVLGSEPRTISLNSKLLQPEELTLTSPPSKYTGAHLYRPGDIIAVGNERSKAVGTQWLVENGICVGWKFNSGGEANYGEPLFVGGGVSGAYTEAELREYVYQRTPDPILKGDRKAHFAEKAIGGPKCAHTLDSKIENIYGTFHDVNNAPKNGKTVAEVLQKNGVSGQEYKAWKKKYGNTKTEDALKPAVPDVVLRTSVERLNVLGGRKL